jgi:predicted RNA-binding Zn-ribbon protein involved in translation (DUF1610 family)
MTLQEEHDQLEQMLQRLANSENDPGEVHVCPVCGGKLGVRFEVYKRKTKRILGVLAQCDTCGTAAAIDMGEPLPSWVQSNDN